MFPPVREPLPSRTLGLERAAPELEPQVDAGSPPTPVRADSPTLRDSPFEPSRDPVSSSTPEPSSTELEELDRQFRLSRFSLSMKGAETFIAKHGASEPQLTLRMIAQRPNLAFDLPQALWTDDFLARLLRVAPNAYEHLPEGARANVAGTRTALAEDGGHAWAHVPLELFDSRAFSSEFTRQGHSLPPHARLTLSDDEAIAALLKNPRYAEGMDLAASPERERLTAALRASILEHPEAALPRMNALPGSLAGDPAVVAHYVRGNALRLHELKPEMQGLPEVKAAFAEAMHQGRLRGKGTSPALGAFPSWVAEHETWPVELARMCAPGYGSDAREDEHRALWDAAFRRPAVQIGFVQNDPESFAWMTGLFGARAPEVVRSFLESSGYRAKAVPPGFEQPPALQMLRLFGLPEYSAACEDPSFALTAVLNDPRNLAFVSKELKDDEALVLAAVEQNGGMISQASERLRNTLSVARVAVATDGRAYDLIGPEAQAKLEDPRKPMSPETELDNRWLLSPERLTELVKTFEPTDATLRALALEHPETLSAMEPRWSEDVELQAAAAKQNASALMDYRELLSDPVRLREVLLENPLAASFLTPARLRQLEAKFPEVRDAYERVGAQAAELGISLWRFGGDWRTLREILHVRTSPASADPRPRAAVLAPANDESGIAFSSESFRALTKRYRVEYHEWRNRDELARGIRHASEGKPLEVLVLGGHGERELIAGGATDPAGGGGSTTDYLREGLDLDSRPFFALAGLGACVQKNGHVILESCSTGEGGRRAENMANVVGRAFPQAHVYAPMKPSNSKLQTDAKGLFLGPGFGGDMAGIGARWVGSLERTYHRKPVA